MTAIALLSDSWACGPVVVAAGYKAARIGNVIAVTETTIAV
jgi:hypothetical protein